MKILFDIEKLPKEFVFRLYSFVRGDVQEEFKKHDIFFTTEKKEADVVLLTQKDDLKAVDLPIMLFIAGDGTQIHGDVKSFKNKNIKLILKQELLKDFNDYNIMSGRNYLKYVDSTYMNNKPEQIDYNFYSKMYLFFGYGILQRMTVFINEIPDFEKKRNIDVNFCGLIDYKSSAYKDTVLLTKHRTDAFNILKEHKNSFVSNIRIPFLDYRKKLYDSKIVVSPWGFGETCYRDYEALYAGNILIKPRSDFVINHPDIFNNKKYFLLFCEPNWSDLDIKIEEALFLWDKTIEKRINNRNLLLNEFKKETIVENFNNIIRNIWK